MSKRKLLNLYGLKWNPFSQDLPTEAIRVSAAVKKFAWRIEELSTDGGFAMVTGDPGTGKSVVLRYLEQRLSEIRDLNVCCITRPQSGTADFYRELGEVFGTSLGSANRWGGFKVLREKWKTKLESSLRRPVILIDEAQEMPSTVLSELRLLASDRLDSQSLLTVVLAGDGRLTDKFRQQELIPLGSRIRTRLTLETMSATDLFEGIQHAITAAGNAKLMTVEVMKTLAEHSFGNWRAAMNMAQELLLAAAVDERIEIDEQLYFDVFAAAKRPRGRKKKPANAGS